jgi:hypothetical protein
MGNLMLVLAAVSVAAAILFATDSDITKL